MEKAAENPASLHTATMAARTRMWSGVRAWAIAGVWTLIGLASLAAALQGGLKVRTWMWDHSRPIRFQGDIQNAVFWGNQVVDHARTLSASKASASWREHYAALWESYLGLYTRANQIKINGALHLDYLPIRLAVAVLWADHIQNLPRSEYHPWDDNAIDFMLRINIALEALAAAAMFGLVFYWVRRHHRSRAVGDADPAGRRVWTLASAAALLVWFNPALLIDAHVWPQWDVVAVAFFLSAAFLLCVNLGLAAGIMLAIGAMWKGQILMVAPLLVLWPLFEGRWRPPIFLSAGFIAGIALIASPWLVATSWGWITVGIIVAASAAGSIWALHRWRDRAALMAASFGLSLFAIGAWMGGDFNWFKTGFVFGAEQWQAMAMGPTLNLPALLHARWHWQLNDIAVSAATMRWIASAFNWIIAALWSAGVLTALGFGLCRHRRLSKVARPRLWIAAVAAATLIAVAAGILPIFFTTRAMGEHPLSLKQLLQIVYFLSLVWCAFGAARHSRRDSLGFLIALAAPWIIFFAVMGQMHERYLVWGAVMTAACVAVSWGMAWLHLLVTSLGSICMAMALLSQNPAFAPNWRDALGRLFPDAGWMVLLLAAIYLYLAVTNRPRSPAREC